MTAGEQSMGWAWSRGKGMVAGGMASGGGKGAMRRVILPWILVCHSCECIDVRDLIWGAELTNLHLNLSVKIV